MNYKLTFKDKSSAILSHHGTDGMKWGVWNTETREKYKANPALLPQMAVMAGKLAGEAAKKLAATSPEKKTEGNTSNVDDVATSVIRGDYGNGEERRQKLTSAGYDYDTVQSRVNDIIYGRVLPSSESGSKEKIGSGDTDSVARNVIRGDYGNGEERRQKLSSAGYDYNAVQSRVNDIVYGRESKKK